MNRRRTVFVPAFSEQCLSLSTYFPLRINPLPPRNRPASGNRDLLHLRVPSSNCQPKKGPHPFLADFFMQFPGTQHQYFLEDYSRLPNYACDYVSNRKETPQASYPFRLLDTLSFPDNFKSTAETPVESCHPLGIPSLFPKSFQTCLKACLMQP